MFHTRGNRFLGRGVDLEGNLLGNCMKPKGRSKNEGKRHFHEKLKGKRGN